MYKFIILFLLFTGYNCIDNSTFESLTNAIRPINELGNSFFELVRGESNNSINYHNIKYSNLTFKYFTKQLKHQIGFAILAIIALIFIVFLSLFGFFFMFCRLSGKCGGKAIAMDPPRAKCKRICYGIVLFCLILVMFFGALLCLFNNQIINQSVTSHDKSINLALKLKSQSDLLNTDLLELEKSVNSSQPATMTDRETQDLTGNLQTSIRLFYQNLLAESIIDAFIKKSHQLRANITEIPISKRFDYLKSLNDILREMNNNLTLEKDRLSVKLVTCTSAICQQNRKEVDNLSIGIVDATIMDKLKEGYNYLNNSGFSNLLDQIDTISKSDGVDIKMIVDKKIKELKNYINDKQFSYEVRVSINYIINIVQSVNSQMGSYIPLPGNQSNNGIIRYEAVEKVETYRYYGFIVIGVIMLLIGFLYLIGLLFGICASRPNDETKCCHKGIGANFLMAGVGISFLFGGLLMLVVLSFMISLGTVQTDVCRYLNPNVKNGPETLDRYMGMILNMSGLNSDYVGMMQSLLNNSKNQNIYQAFANVINPVVQKRMSSKFDEINNEVVSYTLDHFNISRYQKLGNAIYSENIDPNIAMTLVSISLKQADFLNLIQRLKVQVGAEEVVPIEKIGNDLFNLQATMKSILTELSVLQTDYISWFQSAKSMDSNIVNLIKKYSAKVVNDIQSNLFRVINAIFNRMFNNVKADSVRNSVYSTFEVVCDDGIDYLNGIWYGIGIFVLFIIPGIIFACLLVSLYRRMETYYPDKPAPDYDNYIGFYARADGDGVSKNSIAKTPAHRGYRPIPMKEIA